MATHYDVTPDTNLLKLARTIAHGLASGPVEIDGEFQRLRRLYIELVERMAPAARGRLANLVIPLGSKFPDVKSRLNRRIGDSRGGTLVPLEHLLLTGDFPPASNITDTLFPERDHLKSGVKVSFNDPKGLISIGQHRAVLAVLDELDRRSPAAALSYVIERRHEHVTFHHPVQVHKGVARATIDVAQLEKRSDFARALRDELEAATAGAEPVWLDDDYVRYDQSCAWDFNRAFWRYLSVWENVTGKSYQRALPKGKAESNHQEFIDEAAARLADHVRELEREGSLAPDEELWVSEKAPGSGGFMAGLLDYFRKNHPDYYRRLRVVLSDISADVLSISAHELNRRGHLPAPAEGPRIMFWPLGGGRPPETAGGEFVDDVPRGRFIYMRHANFFDQLPTRLFAHQGGRYYELYVRAAIDPEKLASLEEKYDLTLARLREVIGEKVDLATLDADLKARFINFWSAVWESVKLREDFRPVARMADVHDDGAEIERLFDAAGDLRFVTSDVATAIMREDLRLLHPTNGYACFTDIFLQRASEFNERWIELAKYDNGVWVGTNGLLMTHLLGRDGYRCGYYPVELTLGSPSAVYTMSVSRGDEAGFALTPELIQELTGIAAAEVQESSLTGLPRRVRNNLRDLPALMDSVEPDLDWGRRTFDDSLDLTRLMRELYYHSPPSVGENSLFVKMAALVGDLVDRYRGRRIRIDVDLTEHDLRALEDFLDHRPIAELPLELARIGGNGANGNGDADEYVRVRLRLPTIAHKLRHNEFLMLAEVDLPRAQSLEQLRRRILQFQRHVDAVSLTSGRMADPRFLRSREMLKMPLFRMVQPDRLFVTLEMCERQAADLESDIRGAEAHGVHNIFIVTGDFDRGARWWLDSPHGIALADRLRNGEGADGRLIEHRSRTLVAGALTWSGIPDITSRIERDIELKVRAGADLLFTQPVYDLKLSTGMLDMMAARGLASEVRVVAEILPLLSLEMIRTLSQTPGINVPPEMLAAYERIDANVGAFYGDAGIAALDPEAQATLFADRVFAGVVDIPGFEGFFSTDRAKAIYRPISKAVADARSKTSKGKEFEEGRRAAGRAALTEIGFAMAERIMAALVNHGRVAGFLFVARNGRDLRRLTARTNKLLADDAAARAARKSDNHRPTHIGHIGQISAERGRRYGHELVEVADRLAPLGLALPDGTPTNLRMPAVIQSANREGPTVVTRLDLDDIDESGRLPLEFETLAEALGRRPAGEPASSDSSDGSNGSVDLRVLCVPAGWERNSALMRATVETADCEIRMNLRADDAAATDSRRLRVRVHGEPLKSRIARGIERHPHLYGVAVLGEFWLKHPIFGQVLCGGPCGISGAWQFTCTMGKTFTSKRQIENNLLNRPIFIAARQNAAASTIRRQMWAGYERVMRAMLWPPIALRRGIVGIAGRIPSDWYLDAKSVFQAAVTRAVNHLECPKSLRNGACGAPSATGLCGELMKFGINKPCVFCYRNARDRRGHERAEALVGRARRLRASRWGRIAAPAAALMEIAAAFADRRPLSIQLYPRVDTEVPGASAIVNSMARRYEGATIFGNPDLIPPSIAHSEIELEVRTPESRKILAEVRRRLRNVAPLFENRGLIVATMLEALASSAAGFRPRHERDGREDTTYERMFMAQIGAPPRRADRHP